LIAILSALGGCAAPPLRVIAVGDLQLDGRDRANPVIALDAAADVSFANLEGPLTARGAPSGLDADGRPLPGERIRFAAPPERAAWLRGRVSVVSLANNHAADQGDAGRDDTARALAANGVAAAWEAHDAELSARGRRVTVLARAFPPDAFAVPARASDELISAVKRARTRGVVIVSLHWGRDSLLPSAAQRAFAARLVDAGASAVLGHGSHWPTGVERHGAGVIAYSLGNFAFGCRCTDYADAYALAFTIDAHGAATSVRALPLKAGLAGAVPARATDPHLAAQLEMLSRDLGSTARATPNTVEIR
jgi:Bacterial capsule synthesis protein PGA_cap